MDLNLNKQGKAILARLAKRSRAREIARDRARVSLTPAEFEAKRQQRKVERQTAAAALQALESRLDVKVAELAQVQKAAAQTAAASASELAHERQKVADRDTAIKALRADLKATEEKANSTGKMALQVQEIAKGLEERLNAAKAANAKLEGALKAADVAAGKVMETNASITAERDELKTQLTTLREQYTAVATELEALKTQE